MIYWLFLLAGIITEITGTTLMRALVFGNPIYAQLAATVGISLSYYFVAKAVVKIPVAISYAVWSGVGLGGIALSSFLFFDEAMPVIKIIGRGFVAAGMVVLNMESEPETPAADEASA